MIVFTMYAAGIVFITPYTPCSCGGIITLLSWQEHQMFNIVLIVLALIAIRFHRSGLNSNALIGKGQV